MLLERIKHSLDMIRFEHSVFALPFALTGAAMAFRESGKSAVQGWSTLAWIVVAMVSARSAAMAFNRVVDVEIDARNPRTRTRHLIELGGLVVKAGIVDLTGDDRAIIYGALLWMADKLQSDERDKALALWAAKGKQAFEDN